MAEELDIRSLWNKSKELEDPKTLQINMMERKGTRTTLYWIKTILWIEFWLTIVLVPIAIYYGSDTYGKTALTIYAILCIGYLFYYQFLIRQINQFSYDRNVVDSLKKVYGYLWFYLLHYKVVIWLSVVIGIILGIYEPENQALFQQFDGAKDWATFIGIMAVLTGIAGGLMTFLVHLIYGRKIKRLKRMVKDLEREE